MTVFVAKKLALGMGARIIIEQPTSDQLQLLLRQDFGEVMRFLFFVLFTAGALFVLIPQVRSWPAPLLGLLGGGIAWGAIAASASECYLFDRTARTLRIERLSLLGRTEQLISIQRAVAVQQVVRGPQDNRLVLELITGWGEMQLRLPHRLITLEPGEQLRVGRLIADHLGLPLLTDEAS
jgi:hypothetical protein